MLLIYQNMTLMVEEDENGLRANQLLSAFILHFDPNNEIELREGYALFQINNKKKLSFLNYSVYFCAPNHTIVEIQL